MRKALLITYPDTHMIEEAKALAEAAEYAPVRVLSQHFLSRSKFGVGSGKAEEAARIVREEDLESVIFDAKLNPSQTYNLAKLCHVEVKDREKVILEIFAKRATTAEAGLQVRLAELNYELSRARDKVRMAKRGEQPGFFGLGKYEVDIYVRAMKKRMVTLKRKVEEVRKRRVIFRQRREKTGIPSIAITGYTGAGKTTLFNRLVGESKDVDAGVFTTLSTTTRGVTIDHTRLLVSDTVGFIDRLPTYMIEAFKSTLEEASYSTMIVLLVDASQSDEKLARNFQTCINILGELGVPEGRVLTVMNKVDLVSEEELGTKFWTLGLGNRVGISAATGKGVEDMLRTINERLLTPEYGTHMVSKQNLAN